MYNKYKLLAIFGIIVTLLSPQLTVIGQDIASDSLNSNGLKMGELANCFDVYKFQSIEVTVGVDKSVYKPSDVVEIGASITNNNPYPIIDSTIRARILRSHPNPVERRARYVTVDDKVIKENITLKANENYPFEHTYFVPINAPSGEYVIQYYIYNQDRFNLGGLSFTEDIISNKTSFNVEGGGQHIYLDKTNITIDGKEYDSRGFMVQVGGNKKNTVKTPLVNPENTAKDMEIKYKLYKWDELLESNLVEEKSQQVTVPANGKVDLEYSVETNTDPVYYLLITANALGERETDALKTKTMAHIRLSVEGKNRPRINWVGLDKYPFSEGEEVKVMTCAHNTTYAIDKGPIRVQSIIKDSKGKELTKIEYEGEMPSAISGIMNKFKAPKNINQITIDTSLYNANNELVDNITTTYDCNELSPESCIKEESGVGNIFGNNKSTVYIIVLGVILLSVSTVLVKRYNKIKK